MVSYKSPFKVGPGAVPQGLSVQANASQQKRVPRRPTHTFFVEHHPYVIQPFMIAPVLPGETLTNLMLQARAVSDPLTARLTGWWLEHYVFYVPLTALDTASSNTGQKDARTPNQAMLMDLATPKSAGTKLINTTGIYAPASANNEGYDWISDCLRVVVDGWFRKEGEAYTINFNDGVSTTQPIAALRNRDVGQSMFHNSELPADVTVETTSSDISLEALESAYQTWMFLSAQQLTNQTWEEYLETFGVHTPTNQMGKVELLRMSNQWTYPTNTVEPTTGTPSSAVSWSIDVRADKKRFFREPGFIFGITLARPKTYRSGQTHAIACNLISALDWMPAIMKENVQLSLRTYDYNKGPFIEYYDTDSTTSTYVLDIRDLYTHGDQYLSNAAASLGHKANVVGIVNEGGATAPTNSNVRFPTFASVEAMFAGASDATRLIYQDGACTLNIMGTQLDHTPG